MSVPLAAVLCTTLLVLCVSGGVIPETEDRHQIVDSDKVVIFLKQDEDDKWVNEVKLEHGTELAPWKVGVEQKTLDRGGRQSVELTATLTGPARLIAPGAPMTPGIREDPKDVPARPRILAGSFEDKLPEDGGKINVAPSAPTPSSAVRLDWDHHPSWLSRRLPKEGALLRYAFGGSQYTLHTAQVDWVTANKTCAEEGAHLAIINSEEEAEFLARMLRGIPDAHRGAFVGITDEEQEGTWLTIFGLPIASAGFARWFRSDQPDNANGKENCGAIFTSNGGFNDVPCTGFLMHSFCEKKYEATNTIATKDDDDKDDYDNDYDYECEPESDYKQFPGSTSLYKVQIEQMDWATSNQTCVEEGAHLAVINSEGEAMMLAALLTRSCAEEAFVGITDEAEEGTWLTIFGKTTAQAGFARWYRGDQPHNENDNKHCGSLLSTNGGFNDVPCTGYPRHSICEKEQEPLDRNSLLSSTTSSANGIEPETETTSTDEIEPQTETKTTDEIEYQIETMTNDEIEPQTVATANDEIEYEIYETTTDETHTFPTNDMKTQRDMTLTDPIARGYVKHSDQNYYKFHFGAYKNYEEAKDVCKAEGGSLAYIFSKDEFLLSKMARSRLEGSGLAFTGVGYLAYPEDSQPAPGFEECSAINVGQGSFAFARCQDRLPFFCKIEQHHNVAVE